MLVSRSCLKEWYLERKCPKGYLFQSVDCLVGRVSLWGNDYATLQHNVQNATQLYRLKCLFLIYIHSKY